MPLDPMAGPNTPNPEPFGMDSYGNRDIGGLVMLGSGDTDFGLNSIADLLPGQENAFDYATLTKIIDETIASGVSQINPNIGGIGSEAEYLLGNLSPNKEINPNIESIVTDLMSKGLVTAEDVGKYYQIPTDIVQAAYNKNVAPEEIVDPTADTTANDLLEPIDMLDPDVTGIGGDETIVTDDPSGEWEKVDKTGTLDDILAKAMDIFGAYNRDAIRGVVDVVNDRGLSVYDVATATGNTPESLNQAAAESGTSIQNQEPPTVLTGGSVTPSGVADTPVATVPQKPQPDPQPESQPKRSGGIPEPVVDDTPKTPTMLPPLPEQKTTNLSLFQSIVNETPITESILFKPRFTELDNIPQGMFEAFLRATGGR